MKLLEVIFLVNWMLIVDSYNLSPVPSYVILEPTSDSVSSSDENGRSSYFGYSIALRENSIMIGAPRAKTALLPSKDNATEPGAIYKYNFTSNVCHPYEIITAEDSMTTYTLHKDHQLLGVSMDGLGSESQRLSVCASNIETKWGSQSVMNGVCYILSDTESEKSTNNFETHEHRAKSQHYKTLNQRNYTYYASAQLGFSAHATDVTNEFVFGAPGVGEWKGSVFVDQLIENNKNLDLKDNVISYDPTKYNYQENNTYFGYSVSSAFFNGTKLLYVASAPRANNLVGEVVIFNYKRKIDPTKQSEAIYEKKYSFKGHEIGEYFGYALVTDDFDNDGLIDIAISAPFNADGGRVYVYLNRDNRDKLEFEKQKKVLVGDRDFSRMSSSQFGISMSKLGDINQDGYGDLAVGAPFENDVGAVYIFMGSIEGLRANYSQKLQPSSGIAPPRQQPTGFFGFSLSRGVDMDTNGFNDLAIGAPNSMNVFIFKSYPSIEIISTAYGNPREIPINNDHSEIEVCAYYKSLKNLTKETITVSFNITLDTPKRSATFTNNFIHRTFDLELKRLESKCDSFKLDVTDDVDALAYPISVELQHSLKNSPNPDLKEFCTDCVMLNPYVDHFIKTKIPFVTECKNKKRCVADLKITSVPIDFNKDAYILESTPTIAIHYMVENMGETAFLPQFTVELPKPVTFREIPSSCKIKDLRRVDCFLQSGQAMDNNTKTELYFTIDTIKLNPGQLIVRANVSSTSDDANYVDNRDELIIECIEFSEIEITGKSKIEDDISIEDEGLASFYLIFDYKIRNFGPSHIRDIQFTVDIPSQVKLKSTSTLNIVDLSTLNIFGSYNNHELDSNKNTMDSNNIPIENSMSTTVQTYDRVTRQIINLRQNKTQPLTHIPSYNENNRFVLINCTKSTELNECLQATIQIKNLIVGPQSVDILLKFAINLAEIDKLLTESKDTFILSLISDIKRSQKGVPRNLKIKQKDPFIIVTKFTKLTPWWIYLVAAVAGILVLVLLTFILYKVGFFKRTKKEQMKHMVEEEVEINNAWIRSSMQPTSSPDLESVELSVIREDDEML